MVFEHIHKLQEQFTDKFVTVDASRPELKRFDGLVGVVKTVNFSGRALVQFDEWINNIGWFDIDTNYLKLADPSEVERIAAKKAEAKSHKKEAPAPAATHAKGEKATPAAKTPAKAPAKAGGMSVAEMMAAARGSAGAAPAAKKETPAKETPAAGAKKGGMSVAEMMAAARASAGGAAPAHKAEAPATKAPAKPDPAPVAEEPAEEAPPPAPAVKAAAADKPKGKAGALPKDVPGIVAYCRQADNK